MTLDELLAQGHGRVTSAEAARYGLRTALRAARSAGRVVLVARGRYVEVGTDPALTAALATGGLLSCQTAAAVLGLPAPETAPHVTIPRGTSTDAEGCVVHRRDVRGRGGVTGPARTVADCLRCLPPPDAVVVGDAALNRRLVTVGGILANLAGRDSARPRSLTRLLDGRSMSPGESRVRVALVMAGLRVVPQFLVPGVGYVDLLVGDRLVVEVDGFAFHSSRRDFLVDRRRTTTLQLQGYVVLRVPHEDAVFRTDEVVATVLALLARL